MVKMRLIATFAARRAALGWSQDDLARQSGVPISTIRQLEHGLTTQPHRAEFDRICHALQLDPDSIDVTPIADVRPTHDPLTERIRSVLGDAGLAVVERVFQDPRTSDPVERDLISSVMWSLDRMLHATRGYKASRSGRAEP